MKREGISGLRRVQKEDISCGGKQKRKKRGSDEVYKQQNADLM